MNSRAKTLTKYVLPTVLGNCAFFLFTIIDGIFVGNGVGTNALGAINLVMPFIMILNALVMLTVIGGVTVTAIRLGRGDTDGANQAFMHSFTATLIIAFIMSIAGTILTPQIAALLGANETYFQMVCDYLFWYSLFAIPASLFTFMNNFCRNDGSPVLVSAASIVATAVNIFLDWLFVFPLGMGLKGAAIATGISQTLGMLIVLSHFILKHGRLRFRRYIPQLKLYGKIILRGAPESVAQFSVPVATLCTNYVLLSMLGDTAVNAYSIICYVASFSVAIFFGAAEGLQPLFGQAYGAKNSGDLKYYLRAGVIINLVGSILITIALFFVGGNICAMFGAEAATLEYTVRFMPWYSWGFIITSLNTLFSAYFYSTKRTAESLIMNIFRSFIGNTLVIFALPAIFGGNAIWCTMGVYELISFILAFTLYRRSEKKGIQYK